jgi:hypothetical protein
MRKRAHEAAVAGVLVAAATAAALGSTVFRGKDVVEGHAVAAATPSHERMADFSTQMDYKTMVVAQNILDLYYQNPDTSSTSPGREGILHRVEMPLRNGGATYFEERSEIISDPQTVTHIMIGQSNPDHKKQFKITLDKDKNENWTVGCIDNDNELEISNGKITSSQGRTIDPGQAEQAMLAIADKSEEIIGAVMGNPNRNPVQDPVPGICEQFMPN